MTRESSFAPLDCEIPEIEDPLRYSRIIQRLDSLPPSLTELSRRVLGWIGCSPTPLKIQELSCALSVNSSFDRQTSHAEGLLNVVRLCGPIVEISGDYVHLVHFTVKE